MPTKTPRTADQLAEAVRAGDRTVTASDIAAARAAEEFEALQAEARSRQELQQLAEQRDQKIAQLRADIEQLADDSADQLAHVTAATTALAALVAAAQARAARIAELGQRARELGIGALNNSETGATGIGWRYDLDTRKVNTLRSGNRVLTALDPAVLVAKVTTEFQAANRLNARKLPHQSVTELITTQDTVLTPAAQVSVRLTQPFGAHQPGAVIAVDSGTASWLVAKGRGERA